MLSSKTLKIPCSQHFWATSELPWSHLKSFLQTECITVNNTCAKVRLHSSITHDWQEVISYWMSDLGTMVTCVPLVFRVNSDSSITQHRLQASRSYNNLTICKKKFVKYVTCKCYFIKVNCYFASYLFSYICKNKPLNPITIASISTQFQRHSQQIIYRIKWTQKVKTCIPEFSSGYAKYVKVPNSTGDSYPGTASEVLPLTSTSSTWTSVSEQLHVRTVVVVLNSHTHTYNKL